MAQDPAATPHCIPLLLNIYKPRVIKKNNHHYKGFTDKIVYMLWWVICKKHVNNGQSPDCVNSRKIIAVIRLRVSTTHPIK